MSDDVRVSPTRYEVSTLPEDFPEGYMWTISVEYRGRGLWAVLQGGEALGTDGTWDWEPSSSNRDDEWLETHRFPLEKALELAREAAPKIRRGTRFGVWGPQDAIEWEKKKENGTDSE